MENEFNKGIEDLKKLSLTRDDKELILSNLENYIDKGRRTDLSSQFSWFVYLSKRQYVYVALVVLLFTGSGLVFASNNSLPGDLLYPVKINIAEKIEGATMIGQEAQINWQTEKLNRRFEEVEVLAAQGKLNKSNRILVENNLNKTASTLEKVIQDDEATSTEEMDETKTTIGLQVSAHNQILQKIQNNSPLEQKIEISQLRNKIKETSDRLKGTRKVVDIGDFEKKKQEVESFVRSTEEEINKVTNKDKQETGTEGITTSTKSLWGGNATSSAQIEGGANLDAHTSIDSDRILENANIYLKQNTRVGGE